MLTPGTILQSRYRVIRQLSKGGMGTVYEAIDERFDGRVAIKEAHFADAILCKQFELEARLLYTFRHRALTRVIDHFSEGSGQFLVMDFVDGEDLAAALQRVGGPFPVGQVLDWGDELLDALSYLHSLHPPIVHRDIKPHNLKVSSAGQIILLDFGLAKVSLAQSMLSNRSIFGYTPSYAPIEQMQGSGTDSRSDIYALGATLYHLMTGRLPADVLTRLAATTEGETDPLIRADQVNSNVPQEVASVLNSALALSRNQRPQSAGEFRQALRAGDPRESPTLIGPAHEIINPAPHTTVRSPAQKIMNPAPQQTLAAIPPQALGPAPVARIGPSFTGDVRLSPSRNTLSRRIVIGLVIVTALVILAAIGGLVLGYINNQVKSNQATTGNNSNSNTNTNTNSATPNRPANADVYVNQISMAKDDNGKPGDTTLVFEPGDRTIHCVAELNKAKMGTEVRFVWKAVDVAGSKNETIKTIDYTTKAFENKVRGHLNLPYDWPKGVYEVGVYINGALDKTVKYTIE